MTGGGWVVGTVMVSDKSKSGLSSQSPGRLPRTHVCSKLQVTPSQRARCFTYGSTTRVRAAVSGAGRKQVVVVRNVFAPSPLIPSFSPRDFSYALIQAGQGGSSRSRGCRWRTSASGYSPEKGTRRGCWCCHCQSVPSPAKCAARDNVKAVGVLFKVGRRRTQRPR